MDNMTKTKIEIELSEKLLNSLKTQLPAYNCETIGELIELLLLWGEAKQQPIVRIGMLLKNDKKAFHQELQDFVILWEEYAIDSLKNLQEEIINAREKPVIN